MAQALDAAGAQETYQALRAQRSELQSQLRRLEDQRVGLQGQLRDLVAEGASGLPGVAGADQAGIEARIRETDARISSVEGQLAQADLAVAKAAAIPGAVVETSPPSSSYILEPEISIVFTIFVLCPLAIAYARRLWRRVPVAPAVMPAEVNERLDRLAEALDAVAIETERIGEGQRFLTSVLAAEGRIGPGIQAPVRAPAAAKHPGHDASS